MPSEKTNQATRREWRELGFFYDRDDHSKTWRIVGSRAGLERFADELSKFAANPKNGPKLEHEHLGPYMYLEIGSWPEAQITDHWIAGPLPSLERLSHEVRARLEVSTAGDVLSFRELFAPTSPYELRLELRAEPFDPAREDANCW